MSTSTTSDTLDRVPNALSADRWSPVIVVLSVVIVAPATTLWLYFGGIGWLTTRLGESAGLAGPQFQVVVLHPLEQVLPEIAIGVGLAVFVGVDILIARQWLRDRGFVASGPGSIVIAAGAITVWLGLAVAGGAVAAQTFVVPALNLLANVIGLAGEGVAGTPVVRVGTLTLIVGSIALVGAIVVQAGLVGLIGAVDRVRG